MQGKILQTIIHIQIVLYSLSVFSEAFTKTPELTESPLGLSGVGFFTKLFRESSDGDPLKGIEIKRRFLLLDSLRPRWIRVDAGLGTLLPNLAIDKQSGDTIGIWCSDPVDLNRVTPIFRASLIESTFVNIWKVNSRPLLILDYGTNWMSSDTCTVSSKRRCNYQFLPKGRYWLWFLKNLKDSLDKLSAKYETLSLSEPIYLEVWNEPNIFLYHNSLYKCTEDEEIEKGVKCKNDKLGLSFHKPKDPRKYPCYVKEIFQIYVDSLLIPVLEVFGEDLDYRVIATGPGVDPVWKYTQPSWFGAFKVMAKRLHEYNTSRNVSLIPDGIAIHWYHHQGKDSEDSGIRKHLLSTLKNTRDTLKKYAPNLGLDTLVMWITEFGRYAYEAHRKSSDKQTVTVSLKNHFKTLAVMFEILFDKRIRKEFKLGPGFLFSLIDLPGTKNFYQPIGHFGIVSRRYLLYTTLTEPIQWNTYLKPSGYFYKYLSESWTPKSSIPMIDVNGINPNFGTPIVLYNGRIYVSFKGYDLGYQESTFEIVKAPQVYVLELNKNAEIVDIVKLTSFEKIDPNLTIPTLGVYNKRLFLAYARTDSVYLWEFNDRWKLYKGIYTGITPKTPVLWMKHSKGGYIFGKTSKGDVIAKIEEDKKGIWNSKPILRLSSPNSIIVFTGENIWFIDPSSNKVFILTNKFAIEYLNMDLLPLSYGEIGVSFVKDSGRILVSTDETLRITLVLPKGGDIKWSVEDTITLSLASPRYQSAVYRVTRSGSMERDLSDWMVVVDTQSVDKVPSEELYIDAVRSRILYLSVDKSEVRFRSIYSSPLFLRYPFALRLGANTILGFMEGAYDHYILRFKVIKL